MRRALAGGIIAVLLTAPAAGGLARTRTARPAPAAPAAAAAAGQTQTARWQLVQASDEVGDGVGLRWLRRTDEADAAVGMLACRIPTGFYVAAYGLKPRPEAKVIEVVVAGRSYAVPLAAGQGAPADAITAFGPTPAGLLDAIEGTPTFELRYGGQSTGVFAAPDARVTKGLLDVCRAIETVRGKGN
ncbi:hypothetical protein ACO2Q3_03140 [Caulobacter sp. KR2-114]|uniref:hypothetical protein n=1 Tax=Caulobacter sp. KR2-114 TaxID=3400912 RepID=UPI003C0EC947